MVVCACVRVLFLHLLLTHLLECGKPISGIIFQSVFGEFRVCRPLGSSFSHLSKIHFGSLSPLSGHPHDQFWQ